MTKIDPTTTDNAISTRDVLKPPFVSGEVVDAAGTPARGGILIASAALIDAGDVVGGRAAALSVAGSARRALDIASRTVAPASHRVIELVVLRPL
jgi:hypothetical protein